MKRSRWLWLLAIVPLWIALAFCTSWEPILRDGCDSYQWHKLNATTLSNVWTFTRNAHLFGNPRWGEVVTLLLYTPGPYHAIVTPIVELALFWLLTVLALGRRPRLDSATDALMFITIVAMVVVAAPQIGPMLVYRPFTGNYVFGLVACIALLIPYRVHAETPNDRSWVWSPALLALGVCAGMANEHMGPALAVVIASALAWFLRRGERMALWMVAGLIGVVVGGAALYFAPGQAHRYNGLGNRGLIERIVDRTLLENLRIVAWPFAYVALLAPWAALGIVSRWRSGTRAPAPVAHRVSAIALVAAAMLIAITLLGSPMQGPRLYFAAICLICTAAASVVLPVLRQRAAIGVAWVLATGALAYALICLVTTYHVVGAEFAKRIRAIETAPAPAKINVTPYSIKRSRWFIGEDLTGSHPCGALAATRGPTEPQD